MHKERGGGDEVRRRVKCFHHKETSHADTLRGRHRFALELMDREAAGGGGLARKTRLPFLDESTYNCRETKPAHQFSSRLKEPEYLNLYYK